MNAVLEALSFDGVTFVLMTVNIAVVLFVVYRFLFRPVSALLEAREEKIGESLLSAANARKQARTYELMYQERMNNARYQAREIIEQARTMGEGMKKEILEDAGKQARIIVEGAAREIEQEKIRAYREISGDFATMVTEAASRVLRREIRPEEHQQLIDEFLQETGRIH